MVQPLTFVSDFPGYPFDPYDPSDPPEEPPYPPGHPLYQHQTQHMLHSNDYAIGGTPYIINNLAYFNHPTGSGASYLSVQEPDPSPGVNSYTMWADYSIVNPGTRSQVGCMAVDGLTLFYARSGANFHVEGQSITHARSLGGYSGGHLEWHIEVDPDSGQWYCEVTTGGGLAYQACGLTWTAPGSGLLRTAAFGQFDFGGFPTNAQLSATAIGGDIAVRVGLPECPIPPVVTSAARTHAFWLPWGEG